jgi:hypothetical protein
MGQIPSTKEIFDCLIRVLTFYKLYPETNRNRQASVEKLYRNLVLFLGEHQSFALEIRSNAVLCFGETVYEGAGRAGDYIFQLYREGLQWLEFMNGISIEELKKLLEIMEEYSRPSLDEDADDLITKLCKSEPNFICFQDPLDMDSFVPQVEENPERLMAFKEKNIPEVCAHLLSLPDQSEIDGEPDREFNPAELELTPDETAILQKMEFEQAKSDCLGEMFKTLLFVLEHDDQEGLLDGILNQLREEVKYGLVSQSLGNAQKILSTSRRIAKLCKQGHWAYDHYENFFLSMSDSEFLDPLNSYFKGPEEVALGELENFLRELHPQAARILLPIAAVVSSPVVRRMLVGVTADLLASDIDQVQTLLADCDERIIPTIIDVLAKIEGQRTAEIILGFLGHSSEKIVSHALRAMAKAGTRSPQRVFKLIDHKSDIVRKMALDYLGSRKCATAERLLVEYLDSAKFNSSETQFTFESFKALGRCGSSGAYLYLRGALLNGRWYRRMFRSTRRAGAALGLMEMGTDESKQVLGKAMRSGFRGVRLAVPEEFRRNQ